MQSVFIAVLCTLLVVVSQGKSVKERQSNVNENPERFSTFDMQLTKLVAAREKSNVALSPISVKLVLAMLYEGARGNTSKELQQALDIKDAKALSSKRLSAILQSLQASNKGYDIAVGTKIFLDDEATPAPAFEKKIKTLYNATIEKIDFQNTSDAVAKINSWAKTVTRGHIKHLLSEIDSRENTVLLLVNALFFKGLWENQFPLNQTEKGTFFVDGETPITVPFMNAVHNLQYGESPDLKTSIVRLPYQGGKFAMYIMLPFERTGMASLVQNMTPEKVRNAVSEMQQVSVQIKLPKFNFEFSASLAPVLKELGLTEMFSVNADLSGIADSAKELVVSNVIQKTSLEINEQGSVAAVATSIDLVSKFGDHIVDFEAVYPFILYIEDETTNTVVFVAKVSNPEGSGKPIVSASAPLPPSSMPAAISPSKELAPKQGGVDLLDKTTFSFFDVELVKEFLQNGPANWVLSPASVKTALSLVYEGAKGETADELAYAMRLPAERGDAQVQLHAYQNRLQVPSVGAMVVSANRILLRKGFATKGQYQEAVKLYNGDIVTADFDHPETVVKEVNDWCKQQTKGAIPQLISAGNLGANSSMVIVNAIYFKSGWRSKFEPTLTAKACFYTENDECIMTDMMKTRGIFRRALVRPLGAYIVELPYEDDRYSMIIVLPTSRKGLPQVARNLPHSNLLHTIERMAFSQLIISIPKFTIEYMESMKKPLNELGVTTMFSDKADLSGIFGSPANTRISDVIHKAKIVVSEEGTTAAAGSAVFAETLSQTEVTPFKADHPFLFFILDKSLGFLFEGKYSRPDEPSSSTMNRLIFQTDKTDKIQPNGAMSEPYPPRRKRPTSH